MYLIVGLGNPEDKYDNTRHNMGFHAINMLAEKYNIKIKKEKWQGLYSIDEIENEKVILLKPQTYMNLSGESIIKFKNFYKIEDSKTIIIYDDMDVEIGKIKIKPKGGPGSHNGMKSVVECLQTENFPRIRIGIGKDQYEEKIDYVIGNLSKQERENLDKGAKKASEAAEEIIKNGIGIAMNKYN